MSASSKWSAESWVSDSWQSLNTTEWSAPKITEGSNKDVAGKKRISIWG